MSDSVRHRALQWKRKAWRNQFKSKSNDSKEVKHAREEIRLGKLGSSAQFNDLVLNSNYDWDLITFEDKYTEITRETKVLTLKDICAKEIAKNCNNLTDYLLKDGNWLQWKLVWFYITLLNLDSFKIFNLFATNFYKEASFNCHENINSCPTPKRDSILCSKMINSKNHRIEKLFDNLKLTSFINNLNFNAFENIIILEITSSNLNQNDLLELTNLKNLISLRISKIKPSDSTIHNWCSSMKSSKWKNLKILSIPEISKLSFIKLQKVTIFSKLFYIELLNSLDFKKEWPDLDYKNWEIINDISLNRFSWGLKTLATIKKFDINETKELENRSIILDFNIINKAFNNDNSWIENNELWNFKNPIYKTQSLVLKKREIPKKDDVNNSNRKKKIKLNKPTSVRSFFDL